MLCAAVALVTLAFAVATTPGVFAPNGTACHFSDADTPESFWQRYKEEHNKTYFGHMEELRREAWINNCRLIKKHNQEADEGRHTFTLMDNHLSDMTELHYLNEMVLLTHNVNQHEDEIVASPFLSLSSLILPEEIDWREKGFHPKIISQKDCGSCYAFSIANSIQGQIFKETGASEPLSAQQIIDCSVETGNYGCSGGSLRNSLKYLKKVGGIMASFVYPYEARRRKCRFSEKKVVANISSYVVLPPRDELALKRALVKIGPIAVSINASPQTFQLYHEGLYDDKTCGSEHVNHAMLLVGYTRDAWILLNWWGPKWGENGYMRLRRHFNRCGIANYAAYAVTDI